MFKTEVTKEQLETAVKQSLSISQALKALIIKSNCGGSYVAIKKAIALYNIDTSHFTGSSWSKGKIVASRVPTETYLAGKHISSFALKRRLLRECILAYVCNNCKLTEWLGGKIPLHLHHKDGNHLNNKLDNLVLLCPNCHALTENYAGSGKNKNKSPKLPKPPRVPKPKKLYFCKLCNAPRQNRNKSGLCSNCARHKTKIQWPETSELIETLKVKSASALARELGVSDNAIKKRIARYPMRAPE